MSLNQTRIRQLLKEFKFRDLFVDELGWDTHTTPLEITVDGQPRSLQAIAQKRGMVAYQCAAASGERLPDYPTRRRIEQQVAKAAHEHLIIFTDAGQSTQIWQWVKREPGKPAACREHHFHRTQTGEALAQKLQGIAFTLDEEDTLTLVDVTRRHRVFDVERVTKKFYEQFQKEHSAFLKFIDGIKENADCEWYASVMLNRLMFVYFIQKKGFLDNDHNYLRTRLDRCQQEKGKDKFHSFYRYFLLRLFHEGFGKRPQERAADLEKLLGKIPYLNGGMFERHAIEERYGDDIQIPDRAFERIFNYFDQYQWHLDERPLRADNEINPDVLGFIFEKYINQKQMGAYYTKEDITEYISKNTVLPYLFDAARPKCKVAFEHQSDAPANPVVWDLLAANPDRYIYPAVRHGLEQPLPADIAAGEKDVAKRTNWNKPAPEELALPTEIWREVVARRQRAKELRKKLAAGEVRDINDLITLNLDIRQFAQDVIEQSEGPELIRAFWHAIERVTILDPTCGSGAFLFAALNILEPLYEACLDRMEAFVEDLDRSGDKHRPEKFSDFRKVLERVETHPNRRYFIFKSIILNNLFGVDIMEEAVEICKLRLFLKLAAQVAPDAAKDNLGIEPLPDIDFNIRAGNTLVGYATADEVRRCMTQFGGGQMRLGVDDELQSFARFTDKLQVAEAAFRSFRQQQTELGGAVTAKDKADLQKKLKVLEDELNGYLAGENGVKQGNRGDFAKWLKSHQPFHWFIEFYGIVSNGGFDAIIGNPPYAEVPKDLGRPLLRNTFKTALDRWSRDEDLYTMVVERSLRLLKPKAGRFGMILPLSISFSTKRPFIALRQVLSEEKGQWLWSHFDRIPSSLFGNEVRTRCTIAVLSRTPEETKFKAATTSLLRWNAEYRECLFKTLNFARLSLDISSGIPKVSSQVQADVLNKLISANAPLALDLARSIPFNDLAAAAPDFPQPCVFVGGTAYNWFPAWRDIPETTNMDGEPSLPARTAGFRFQNEENANIVFALFCSSMGYWWWAVASDAFNLKKWLLERFPVSISMIPEQARKELAQLGASLRRELKRNYVYKDNKGRIGNFFLPACEKETAAIDAFLGRAVPPLSAKFFEDIRDFNACFSRAELDEEDGCDDE